MPIVESAPKHSGGHVLVTVSGDGLSRPVVEAIADVASRAAERARVDLEAHRLGLAGRTVTRENAPAAPAAPTRTPAAEPGDGLREQMADAIKASGRVPDWLWNRRGELLSRVGQLPELGDR